MASVEMPDCYGCETRKARKEHICCETGGRILPGEQYHYHHGIWHAVDGPASFKVCLEADAIRREAEQGGYPEEGAGFGDLCWFLADGGRDDLLARLREVAIRRGSTWQGWEPGELPAETTT